jgi:hypothetical protein
LDSLQIGKESDASLLAFLHLSEKTATEDFTLYRDILTHDPETQIVLDEILRDETLHMTYTLAQLTRIAPKTKGWVLWRARLGRLWKAYLRIAGAISGLLSGLILTAVYFLVLPAFAWLAKVAERREPAGWAPARRPAPEAMRGQY